MKKVSSRWAKLLTQAASVIAFAAVVTSALPCQGLYYQPVVPQKLRK